MADNVRRVEYFSFTVPDRVGEGARVLMPLKENSVNLVAYLGFPLGNGQSQIDFVPESSAALKKVAERAGLKLGEAKRAFLVQGEDRAGAVADTVRKLAEAKISITAACGTSAGAGRYGMILWVKPSDYDAAARALGV